MAKMDLFECCHVNTNEVGDRFVGIKVDGNSTAIRFPIGYQLPNTEPELRRDIVHLISILSNFSEKRDGIIATSKSTHIQTINFPINAFLTVIENYMANGYFTENEQHYILSDRGKTDWPRTIKRQRPIVQKNGQAVYLKREIRYLAPTNKNLITKIHEHCVYESFKKLGWLFTAILPMQPTTPFHKEMFISVIHDKFEKTFNDNDRLLFQNMLAILNYTDEHSRDDQFYFGTDRFEYIWEKLIDRVFGVTNKQDYFPRTKWLLKHGRLRINPALEPDTIMVYGGNVYILDAKYYRYGITGDPTHLPESTVINKQITYGEYVASEAKFKDAHGAAMTVYNAFIMPFNKEHNQFGFNVHLGCIGEATGDWKTVTGISQVDGKEYERVQGIVIDIRHIMWHFSANTQRLTVDLVNAINSNVYNV